MDEAPTPPEPALLTLIARELATEAYTLEQILARYQLDQEYFDTFIAPNEFFKRVLAEYTKEWQSIGSTHKRLAFAAAAALEEKLPVLADRMGSRSSGLADAVATAKLFRELAGIATPSPQSGAQAGPGFSIRIDFGSHKVALEAKDIQPVAQEISGIAEGPEAPPQIQHLDEGPPALETILPHRKGESDG